MGYYMTQGDTKFAINKTKISDVLAAIKSIPDEGYGWVDGSYVSAENIDDAFDDWRWAPHYSENGNINGLDFIGQKSGDDLVLFTAIAPFVEDGSYIVMTGEDGFVWRWLFKGGKITEQAGSMVFG